MEPALASLPAMPSSPTGSKTHPKRPQSYTQAIELQAKLADAVGLCREDMNGCLDREVRARIGSALASMVRGWDILEERKRILRGRPLPGHLRPDLPASQRKATKRIALLASMSPEDKESLSGDQPSGHHPMPGAAVSGVAN